MQKFRGLIARSLAPFLLCLLCFFFMKKDEPVILSKVVKDDHSIRTHPTYSLIIGKSLQFTKALEIIGSIHQDRVVGETTLSPLIHVFGRNLEPQLVTRLLQYQRVIYLDLDLCFPNFDIISLDGKILSRGKDWDNEELIHKAVLERLLSDFDNVALLHDIPPLIDMVQSIQGHGHAHFTRNGSAVFKMAKDLESLKADPKIIDLSDTKPDKGSYCTALMRADIVNLISLHNLSSLDFRGKIVLGVPTTSRRTHIMKQHPLLTILLPSLYETCDHNANLKFALLVAYDQDDKYLDHQKQEFSDFLNANRPDNLEIVLVRFPFLGSVSMLWNLLYEIAMNQGAQYFYQLNDDIKFHLHSWPKEFTSWIDANGGFGLTGPCDEAFPDCSLMTQNFVGRGHHETFGFLFPPDLPNWWSDDWLNKVYDCIGKRMCLVDIKISNGNRRDGENPRYHACPYMPSHEILVSHYCQIATLKLK